MAIGIHSLFKPNRAAGTIKIIALRAKIIIHMA
jgi:hypothetical protein